jgi:hypothetical protein
MNHGRLSTATGRSLRVKIIAGTSLFAAVLVCGRMITFNRPPFSTEIAVHDSKLMLSGSGSKRVRPIALNSAKPRPPHCVCWTYHDKSMTHVSRAPA